jgi:hypothetical protein
VTPHGARPEPAERSALSRLLWRSGLLAFWSVVLWGTIVDVALVFRLLRGGPADLAAALLSVPKSDAGWAWGNRIAALLAPLVWVLVFTSLRARTRERDSS